MSRSIRVESWTGQLRYGLCPSDSDKIYVDGQLILRKTSIEGKQETTTQ